jgi:hypothetical protein
MAVPARPASGAPIDSAWGGVAHDTAVAQDIQTGNGLASFSAANQGLTTVTFPRPFASAPVVMILVGPHNAGSMVTMWGQTSSVSATTFGVRLVTTSSVTVANVPFQWIAIGPRA